MLDNDTQVQEERVFYPRQWVAVTWQGNHRNGYIAEDVGGGNYKVRYKKTRGQVGEGVYNWKQLYDLKQWRALNKRGNMTREIRTR